MNLPFELGKEYKFYGVDNEHFKIGPQVIHVIEDPDDGYRSCLGSVEVVDKGDLIFFKRSVDVVKVEKDDDGVDGYRVVSVTDGHEWLRFGTGDWDDYYPYFYFTYTPRTP